MSFSPASPVRRRFALTRGKAILAGVALAALVGGGIPLLAATTAQADPASTVSGNVFLGTSEASTTPTNGDVLVNAYLYDTTTHTATSVAQTDTLSGGWSLGIAQGTYVFEVSASSTGPAVAPLWVGAGGENWPTLNDALSTEISAGNAFYQVGSAPTTVDDAYLAPGGTISGTLIDSDSDPLEAQPVTLYFTETNGTTEVKSLQQFATTTSDNSGEYSFSDLPVGHFTVSAGGANGYALQFYNHKYVSNPSDATPIAQLTAGADTRADFTLEATGTLSGKVTSSKHKALSGILVTAYRSVDSAVADGAGYASTTTAKNGTYTFSSLPPGDEYVVKFSSGTSGSYVTQWYADEYTAADADPIELDEGDAVSGVDATMYNGGSITGTITTETGGVLPSADYTVEACGVDAKSAPNEADCEDDGVPVRADSSGHYRINTGPGLYTIVVSVDGANYQSEYYNNNHTGLNVTTFAVKAGKTVKNINIALEPGATLSGTVLDGSNVPIAGDSVYAVVNNGATAADGHDPFSPLTHTATTTAEGNYTIEGLSPGKYGVALVPTDGAFGWYPNSGTETKAQTFTVTDALTPITNVDFTEVQTGSIVGHVTSSQFPDGDGGITVEISQYRSSTSKTADLWDDTETSTASGSEGDYSFGGLPPGDYLVDFYPDDYSSELGNYYGASPDDGPGLSERVTVTAGGSSDVDNEMYQGGSYTGFVKDSSGHGLADIAVQAANGNNVAYTAADGSFTLYGATTGVHTLGFFPDNDDDGTDYSSAELHAAAVSASLDGNAPVDVGTVTLYENSSISGLVLGTNGKPLKDVEVTAVRTSTYAAGNIPDGLIGNEVGLESVTDKSGDFSIPDLTPGFYYLEFLPNNPYPVQWLGGSPLEGTSEVVDVTTEGVNVYRVAHLVGGGSVTGVVKSAVTGKPLKGVEVDVTATNDSHDYDGLESLQGLGGGYVSFNSAVTNSKGKYTVPGLTGGSYDISAGSENGVKGYTQLDTSAYVNGDTATKLNLSLQPYYQITGTVTGADGRPAVNADVEAIPVVGGVPDPSAIDPDGTGDRLSTTDDGGNYRLYLSPGTYVIEYLPEDDSGATTYLGGTETAAGATRFVVTNATRSGVDQQLNGYSGGISMDVVGKNGESLSGTITYVRDGGGTTEIGNDLDFEDAEVDGTIEQDNLPAGTYTVTINAYSESGIYAPHVISGVVVGGTSGGEVGGDVVDLGSVDLSGEYTAVNPDSLPQVVPGDEPVILNATAPQVGDTLAISDVTGIWDESVGNYFFHWLRNGKLIAGATDDQYQLQPGDAGATISVEVGAAPVGEEFARNFSYTTASTPVVAAADAPINTDAITVAGTQSVGKTLTVSPGSWDVAGVTFTYAWKLIDNGTPIVVGTKPTLKLTTADVSSAGHVRTLEVDVTAHRPGYEDSAPSAISGLTIQPSTAVKQTKASKVTFDSVANTYTVTPGTWSPTGGTISYSWVEYAAGATTSHVVQTGGTTFTPSDTGTRLSVLVTDTRAGYAPTTVEVPVRIGAAVTIDNNPSVSWTGTSPGDVAKIGFNGAYTPEDATLTYQWYRGATAIKGATGASYTFATADIDFDIHVTIIATDPGHAPSTPTSLDVGTVLPATGFTGTNVILSGTASIGRTLTASIPDWAPVPTSVSYQWQRNGVNIKGATKKTYTPVAADLGAQLAAVVTAKRAGYATTTVPSSLTAVVTADPIVNVTAPSIPTAAAVGTLITPGVGTYDVTPKSYTYQWFRNGNAIPYATQSTYRVLPSDLSEQLDVEITPVFAGLDATATRSNVATVVQGATITSSKAPTITVNGRKTSTAHLDATLTGTQGTWSKGGVTLSFQWQVSRVGTDANGFVDLPKSVDGSQSNSLDLDSSDTDDFATGYEYRLVVTAASTGYATSAPITSSVITLN